MVASSAHSINYLPLVAINISLVVFALSAITSLGLLMRSSNVQSVLNYVILIKLVYIVYNLFQDNYFAFLTCTTPSCPVTGGFHENVALYCLPDTGSEASMLNVHDVSASVNAMANNLISQY